MTHLIHSSVPRYQETRSDYTEVVTNTNQIDRQLKQQTIIRSNRLANPLNLTQRD